MNVVVIGGGITGRLVQHAIRGARVYDWGAAPAEGQEKLTRQYGANYLWAPIPGIPCRRFSVITHVDGKPATPETILAYKTKIGKADEGDSNWGRQFNWTSEGFDFEHLPPATINYGMRAVAIRPETKTIVWSNGVLEQYRWLVSTIPLFSLIELMKDTRLGNHLAEMTSGQFHYKPIYVKVTPRPPDTPLPLDVVYVNYLSDPEVEAYRYCDRNGERHYEGLTNMGTIPNKKLFPGKIHAMDESLHQQIHGHLGTVGIHCFGRYAGWNSDELVHETWKQIHEFAEYVR